MISISHFHVTVARFTLHLYHQPYNVQQTSFAHQSDFHDICYVSVASFPLHLYHQPHRMSFSSSAVFSFSTVCRSLSMFFLIRSTVESRSSSFSLHRNQGIVNINFVTILSLDLFILRSPPSSVGQIWTCYLTNFIGLFNYFLLYYYSNYI